MFDEPKQEPSPFRSHPISSQNVPAKKKSIYFPVSENMQTYSQPLAEGEMKKPSNLQRRMYVENHQPKTGFRRTSRKLSVDDDQQFFEENLDPFQNFRFRRRPDKMAESSLPNFIPSKKDNWSKDVTLSNDSATSSNVESLDGDEGLEYLPLLSEMKPFSVHKSEFAISQNLNEDQKNEERKRNNIFEWQKGIRTNKLDLD